MGIANIFLGVLIVTRGFAEMLTTGNQLKAARALAGLSQSQLAAGADVNVTTISAMEGKGAGTLASGLDTIKAVMDALEAAGVELMNHGQPGCRLKAK
jgi:transcriptional regulator with XRE-family HTH domain